MRLNKITGLFLLCASHYGYAQTSRVSGNLHVDTLLVTCRNLSNPKARPDRTDTLITRNGAFSFNPPAEKDLYIVELSGPLKTRTIRFLSVPGERAVIENWDGKVTGSGFYQRWNAMEQKLSRLKTRSVKFMLLAGSEKNRAYRDSSEIYQDRLQKTVRDYMRNHPEDPLTVMMMRYLPGEDKENAFNRLSPSVRNGCLAPYAREQIRQYQEDVKERDLAEQRDRRFKEEEIPHREIAERIYSALGKKELETGDFIPDLKFTDIDGKEFSLNSLKGKYVLIDVWASWCGPCRRQMPHLKKLEETLKDKDIAFVGITTDIYSGKLAWEAIVKKGEPGGVQLYAGGSREVFVKLFKVTSIPRFILLDKEGRIINLNVPYPSEPATLEILQNLKGI